MWLTDACHIYGFRSLFFISVYSWSSFSGINKSSYLFFVTSKVLRWKVFDLSFGFNSTSSSLISLFKLASFRKSKYYIHHKVRLVTTTEATTEILDYLAWHKKSIKQKKFPMKLNFPRQHTQIKFPHQIQSASQKMNSELEKKKNH